jgi:hypothetical protein
MVRVFLAQGDAIDTAHRGPAATAAALKQHAVSFAQLDPSTAHSYRLSARSFSGPANPNNQSSARLLVLGPTSTSGSSLSIAFSIGAQTSAFEYRQPNADADALLQTIFHGAKPQPAFILEGTVYSKSSSESLLEKPFDFAVFVVSAAKSASPVAVIALIGDVHDGGHFFDIDEATELLIPSQAFPHFANKSSVGESILIRALALVLLDLL